jgi:hypothetical protein
MAQAEHLIIAIGALMVGANAKTSTSPVRGTNAECVLAMARRQPHPTKIDPEASDLEKLTKVPAGLSVYVRAILDDRDILDGHGDAVLSALAPDVAGTIRQAADDMAERLA